MKNKVCFIIPYFGTLPVFFPLFINSVKDKAFDVFFFTDIVQPDNLPANVVWNLTSLKQVKVLFDNELNIDVSLERAYKFCDYKPSFGLVFQKHIVNYQFWGSIDIDTVIGDFNYFITEKLLGEIDIFSGVKEYLSGSMFLVRNNIYCNTLFKKSKDWERVFKNDKSFAFDECGGHYHHQLQAGANLFDLKTEIQSFTEVIFLEMEKGLKTLFTDMILEPGGLDYVTVDANGISYLGRQYLLIHFIYFKTQHYFKITPAINKPVYYISCLGNFNKKPDGLSLIFSENLLIALKIKLKNVVSKFRVSNNKIAIN